MLWGLSVCDWATWRHHNVSVLPLCSGDCRCATELHGGTTTLVFYHCGWTVEGWYKREWTVGVRLSYMEAPQRWCSTTVAGQCEGWYKREWTVGVRLSYMEAPQRWCSTTVLWNGLSVCDWATWRHHNVSVLPLCSGDCRCATELHGGTTTLVFYHCGWTVRGMI